MARKSSKNPISKKTTAKAPKTKKNPNGAGAKPYELNWIQIEAMCRIQCTGEEIASVLNVDYDTIANDCKRRFGIKFSDYIAQKREGGKASLRRWQWTAAERGSNTMQIWLGKNHLGQSDKIISHVETSDGDSLLKAMKEVNIDE